MYNHKEYMKEYRKKNREKIKEYMKEYRKKNQDKIREQNKEYMGEYGKRPEVKKKRKAYNRLPYVKENKKVSDKKYCGENKEKIYALHKKYREAHKEEFEEYHKEYRKANKKILSKNSKKYREKLRELFETIFKKGKKCEHCGYGEYYQILQFHHHKGDKSFSISTFRRMKPELIKKEVDKCILICPNCHFWLHFK